MRETHARRACDDASRLEASGPGRQQLRQNHEQVGRLEPARDWQRDLIWFLFVAAVILSFIYLFVQ